MHNQEWNQFDARYSWAGEIEKKIVDCLAWGKRNQGAGVDRKLNQNFGGCNSMFTKKVNEGLYNTLEAANKIRADAEAEVRKIAEDNTILN